MGALTGGLRPVRHAAPKVLSATVAVGVLPIGNTFEDCSGTPVEMIRVSTSSIKRFEQRGDEYLLFNSGWLSSINCASVTLILFFPLLYL